MVLSACVWCLCKRERKTGSERTGVREREGGPWCKTTEKTNRKGCEKYNWKKEEVYKGHSQKQYWLSDLENADVSIQFRSVFLCKSLKKWCKSLNEKGFNSIHGSSSCL